MKVPPLMDACPQKGAATLGTLKWALLVFVLLQTGALAKEAAEPTCLYNGRLIVKESYDHYSGWNCYENNSRTEETTTTTETIYVCKTPSGLKVPCLKENGKYVDFGTETSRVQIVERTKSQQLKTCLQNIADCNNDGSFEYQPDEPDIDDRVRIWAPGKSPLCDMEPRSKFHVAMLSISLVMGVPASILISYFLWNEKNAVMGLHRNLIIGLTLRTFMTLLIQTELILPSIQSNPINWYGLPALATFETLANTLVLNFWVLLAFYIWKFLASDFKMLPVLTIYNYISIGVSISLTIIWVIVVGATQDLDSWVGTRMWHQWINEPIRILYLGIQLYLTGYVTWKIVKDKKRDGGNIGLSVRRENLNIILLTPFFLLQFCLNAGTPDGTYCDEAFFYTLYFIDGIQCAITCLLFFYIDSAIMIQIAEIFGIRKPTKPVEKPISTIGSLMDRATIGNDIVYSSVVSPDRFEKTMGLYQKHNLTPKMSVTVIDGEAFKTCQSDVSRKISTVSEYYDVESLNEFHDASEITPRKQELSVQHSAVSFKSISEIPEPNQPVQEVQQETPSKNHQFREKKITPILDSKYSSASVESESSYTDSEDGQQKIEISGIDNTESKDNDENDSTSVSSSGSSTSADSFIIIPQPIKVDFLQVKKRDNRYSTEVNRGSTSDDDHHRDGLDSLGLLMMKKDKSLNDRIDELIVSYEDDLQRKKIIGGIPKRREERLQEGASAEPLENIPAAKQNEEKAKSTEDPNIIKIPLPSVTAHQKPENEPLECKEAIVRVLSEEEREALMEIPSVVITTVDDHWWQPEEEEEKIINQPRDSSDEDSFTEINIKPMTKVESNSAEISESSSESDTDNERNGPSEKGNSFMEAEKSNDFLKESDSSPSSDEDNERNGPSEKENSFTAAEKSNDFHKESDSSSSSDEERNIYEKRSTKRLSSEFPPQLTWTGREAKSFPGRFSSSSIDISTELEEPRPTPKIQDEHKDNANTPELNQPSFSSMEHDNRIDITFDKATSSSEDTDSPSSSSDEEQTQPKSLDPSDLETSGNIENVPKPVVSSMPITIKAATLPDIYADLKRPPSTRPLSYGPSVEEKRNAFAKMFSKPRSSIVNRPPSPNRRRGEAHGSRETKIQEPSFGLRKAKASDALNRTESRSDSSDSSNRKSDSSDSESSIDGSVHVPRQIIVRDDDNNDWEPQRLSFTNH